MFDIRHQEQRIKALRTQLGAERQAAAGQLRLIVPQTRRAAMVGSFVWGARKALPLLQPLAIGLVRRGVGVTVPGKLVKVLGLSALAFGAWRLLRSK